MADEVWYYLEDRQQRGPVSFEELQALVKAGTIKPGDLVWSPEMSEWAPASSVPDLVPSDLAAPPPPPAGGGTGFAERSKSILEGLTSQADSLPHLAGLSRLLDWLQERLSVEKLNTVDRVSRGVGHWSYLLAVLVLAVAWIILGAKAKEGSAIAIGLIGLPLGGIVLHYIGTRFLDAGPVLLAKSPSQVSQDAFLRCFGLLALLGALGSFLQAIWVLFDDGNVTQCAAGLALGLILVYVGGLSLSPESVHVEVVEEAGAGEEALGVLMFLVKLPLRLVYIAFAAGAVAVLCVAFVGLYEAFDASGFGAFAALSQAVFAAAVVALLPFLVYLLFLTSYFLLAIYRAILAVPTKIEQLEKSLTGSGSN